MSEQHIMFQKMSQLIDNDIATEEEKSFILDHIHSCDMCKREYARLQEMMKLFSHIRSNVSIRADLSGLVLQEYATKKRKKSIAKIMPAVAAAVVFIFAFGFNSYWQGTKDSSKMVSSTTGVAPASDTRNVIDIISHNNAKIIKITDLYIEGEVPTESFKRLRKELGFRKVAFAIVRSNGTGQSNFIEEVGTVSNQTYTDSLASDAPLSSIRFRVYK